MSSLFEILDTPIAGVRIVQRQPIIDPRGYFERLFCQQELSLFLDGKTIVQVNHSRTVRAGVVRGLHFQHAPYAETKFVSCLRGAVWDVALDLRQQSSTFLRWHAEILSADNNKMLVVPEGCAHGFQTLADDCEMIYFHTAPYVAAAESGVSARDPRVAIAWPLPITEQSARDQSYPLLPPDFRGLMA